MTLLSRSAFALLLALVLAPAVRAERNTALSWVREPGAEGCIAATELGQRVERIVGPVLAPASAGEISIEGRIAKQGDRFVATVTVSDGAGKILGRREVQSASDDCRALDDQVAFVIAVAIDPNAALAELPGELSQEDEPGAALLAEMAVNPPKPLPLAAHRGAPPARRVRAADSGSNDSGLALGGSVGAGVSGTIGLLPAPGVGLAADAALFTGSWSHRVRGVLWFPQREVLEPGAEVDFGALELDLLTCPQLWASAEFALALCGGGVAARLSAEPVGFAGVARDHWLFGVALHARLARRIAGPAWAVLSASGQSLWPRHQIVYQQAGAEMTLHRVAPVTGTAAISIELRF